MSMHVHVWKNLEKVDLRCVKGVSSCQVHHMYIPLHTYYCLFPLSSYMLVCTGGHLL